MKPTILEKIKFAVIKILVFVFNKILKNDSEKNKSANQKLLKCFLSMLYEKHTAFDTLYFDLSVYNVQMYLQQKIESYKDILKLTKNKEYLFYLDLQNDVLNVVHNKENTYNLNQIYANNKDVINYCNTKINHLKKDIELSEKFMQKKLLDSNYLLYDYIEGFIY